MKNPFLSPRGFTFIKEHQKNLSPSKSKQKSNSSFSSCSSYESNFSNYEPQYQTAPRNSTKFQRQYHFHQNQRQKQITKRRVKVFGIDELRYKPEYLQPSNIDSINLKKKVSLKRKSIKQDNKQPIQVRPNMNKRTSLDKSTQILMKQQGSQKNFETNQNIHQIIRNNQKRQSSIESCLGTMINLHLSSGSDNNNQNYTSSHHINSHKRINKKKKTFEDVNQSASSRNLITMKNSSSYKSRSSKAMDFFPQIKQVSSEDRSEHTRSKKSEISKKVRLKDDIKEESQYQEFIHQNDIDIPSSIFIKDRLFYLSKNIKIKK